MIQRVIFHKATPVVVPTGPIPSTIRVRLHESQTLREATRWLEAAANDPEGTVALAADFSPVPDYARRLLNSIAAWRRYPRGSAERQQADAAWRAVGDVLLGPTRRGRAPRAAPDSPTLIALRVGWRVRVRDLFRRDPAERGPALLALARSQGISPVHQTALRRLLRQPHVCPARVADQLAAWTAGVSYRRVRLARPAALRVSG